jgi:hypothetical protein
MKPITKYLSEDGSEFKTEATCLKHEKLVAKIKEVMSVIPPAPKDKHCKFANGGGYIQHDKAKVEEAINGLMRLCWNDLEKDWEKWAKVIAEEGAFKYRHSVLVRIMDEGIGGPVNDAFYRFGRFDDQYREWGQPYYALNPDKGTQVEWKEK